MSGHNGPELSGGSSDGRAPVSGDERSRTPQQASRRSRGPGFESRPPLSSLTPTPASVAGEAAGAGQTLPEVATSPGAASGSPRNHYGAGRRVPIEERLARHVATAGPDECWEWTAAKYPNGYGDTKIDGRHVPAHRAIWLTFVGPIADGLHVHHHCHNRACVNPDHLEPVTPAENIRASAHLLRATLAAKSALITECPHGHPKTPENTYTNPNTGRRSCRPCGRIASLTHYHKRRSAE